MSVLLFEMLLESNTWELPLSMPQRTGFHLVGKLLQSVPARSTNMDATCYMKLKRRLILWVMSPRVRGMKNPLRVQIESTKMVLGTQKTCSSCVDDAPISE